jgi:hypothetical protein
MALIGAGGNETTGGSTVPSPAPNWTGLFGQDTVSTNTQTITGIGAPISIEAALSGGGVLSYQLNGVFNTYSGAFSVAAGATLGWTVTNINTTTVAGNLTVTNESDGGATLATIAYAVTQSGGGVIGDGVIL